MRTRFGSGLHAAPGRAVDTLAYDRYLGRWSRLFVPALIAAAEVSAGHRVLDVATGPGEAAPHDASRRRRLRRCNWRGHLTSDARSRARPPGRPIVFASGRRRPGITLQGRNL